MQQIFNSIEKYSTYQTERIKFNEKLTVQSIYEKYKSGNNVLKPVCFIIIRKSSVIQNYQP